MSFLKALLFSAACAFASAAHSADVAIEGTLSDADRAAILEMSVDVDVLWDARRAPELAALYTKDGSLEMVGRGRGATGRDGIQGYFALSFAGLDPAMRHETRVKRLTVLAPGVVAADAEADLIRGKGPDATIVRRFVTSNVVVKEGDAWKIRLVRTFLLPDPQPAKTAS